MANDQRAVPFSESSVLRGVHGGISADALPNGYISRGANIQVRGGFIQTRPRFRSLGTHALNSGAFRGAGTLSLNSGDYIIFSVGTSVYEFNPADGAVTFLRDFPTDTGPHFFVQASHFIVVQNGVDAPIIYERGVGARSAETDEIPPGYMMAYAHGRIYLVPAEVSDGKGGVVEGRPYWVAGDIALPLDPSNVLKMTETSYWNEGGATGLPFEAGFISALAVLHNAQTSTDLGALLAFGRGGVSAYQVNASREDWKNLDFSQVLFTGEGATSQRAVTPVSTDVFFRAASGVRSVQLSAAGDRGWAVKAISYEVDHRLSLDGDADLSEAWSSFANNRYLLTTAGRDDVSWNGVISLDTLVASTLTSGNSAPAYDDLWLGNPIFAVCACRIAYRPQHVLLFRRGDTIDFSVLDDTLQDDYGDRPVTSRFYTRAYTSRDTSMRIDLQHVDVVFRDIRGALAPKVYYRTDFYSRWTPCSGTPEVENQTRAHLRFSVDATGCREDGTPPQIGHSVQICVEWTGTAAVERWTLMVNPTPVDAGSVLPCNRAGSTLSESLDRVMVPLDDVVDLMETY